VQCTKGLRRSWLQVCTCRAARLPGQRPAPCRHQCESFLAAQLYICHRQAAHARGNKPRPESGARTGTAAAPAVPHSAGRLSGTSCGAQAAKQALEERLRASDGSRGADAQALEASLQEQVAATAAAREVRAVWGGGGVCSPRSMWLPCSCARRGIADVAATQPLCCLRGCDTDATRGVCVGSERLAWDGTMNLKARVKVAGGCQRSGGLAWA
jgi:hypothetical protein